MPAASPPKMRATTSTLSVQAKAASRQAGTDSAVPSIISSLRP